jgi:hypothetical protein
LAPPALAASEHRANLSYQDTSQNAQQGEVLSAVDDIKEAFIKFKQFRDDPKGSIVRWVGGPFGMFITLLHEMINAIIGDANQVDKAEWSGGGSEGGGGSGGGSGGDYDGPTNYIPPGAIPMPPGDWYFSGGAVGAVNGVIAGVITTPPASGVYYAYNFFQDLGAVPAYAAGGYGFESLGAILGVWKAFRNITYALMAIFFLIVGVMIMFRFKISPQAVLTVENALPRLIGTIILITFSYAIAGFMVDLMYVILGLGSSVIASSVTGSATLQQLGKTINFNGPIYLGPFYLVTGVMAGVLPVEFIIGAMGAMIGGVIGFFVGGVTALPGAIVGTLLVGLIFLVIILFLLIKLFISLIKTYISIVFLIIFAPFQIMMGTLPGLPGGFGSWLKSLVANLLVFPAVVFTLMISHTIIVASISKAGTGFWVPPLLSYGIPGHQQLGAGGWVAGIIGLGILFLLPSVPDLVRSAFGIKGGIGGLATAPLAAAGGFFGAAGGLVTGPVIAGGNKVLSDIVGEAATNFSAVQALRKKLGLPEKEERPTTTEVKSSPKKPKIVRSVSST